MGDQFYFSNQDFEFCQTSLVKVSRTFALNIKVLNGELYRSVLLCYLLCRIVDTVEDSPTLDAKIKSKLLLEFPRFLSKETFDLTLLNNWIQSSLQGEASKDEKELLTETFVVIKGHFSLPGNYQDNIKTCVTNMCQGMAKYINKFSHTENIVLQDRSELEEYCYYVAGTVGEFLTDSFIQNQRLPQEVADSLQKKAVSFGLGLQMANISKDLMRDRKRGWTYLPKTYMEKAGLDLESFFKGEEVSSIKEVHTDLLYTTIGHLEDALTYTLNIPSNCIRLRLFCLWPLWMALETLVTLKENQDRLFNGENVKISRQKVYSIMASTFTMAPSNFLLKRSFNKGLQRFYGR